MDGGLRGSRAYRSPIALQGTMPVPQKATAKVTISNRLGLHARPAMVFVEIACKFKSSIAVRRCDQNELVDGKSIMQLMMLAATHGTEIEITASDHADASEAVQELVALVESKFQEE